MLHTKFCGNRQAGSGEEDFLKGFHHIWAWRPSWVMQPAPYQQFFISMYPKAYMQNLVKNGPVVSEKSMF